MISALLQSCAPPVDLRTARITVSDRKVLQQLDDYDVSKQTASTVWRARLCCQWSQFNVDTNRCSKCVKTIEVTVRAMLARPCSGSSEGTHTHTNGLPRDALRVVSSGYRQVLDICARVRGM
eukprot:1195791-Prorocentrum_minimum.AAC.10